MSEIIQFNTFSKFHDGASVFFCKTDLLEDDFKKIKNIKNNVLLITGNSDYSITKKEAKQMPTNVIAWFCQNNLSSNKKIISIPMGVENSFESKREGHGVGWEQAIEKIKIMSSIYGKKTPPPTKLIYANFNINTNPKWRSRVKNVCDQSNFISTKNDLPYSDFVTDVLDHEAVICPIGNAPNEEGDNHRVYETLYLNRIPIVFSHGQKIMYNKIYKFLPVVILDNPEQLLDKHMIIDHIKIAKQKTNEMINVSFWEKKIIDYIWLLKK